LLLDFVEFCFAIFACEETHTFFMKHTHKTKKRSSESAVISLCLCLCMHTAYNLHVLCGC
jgi:hypothetical protein